jgi:hypothetical protein
MILGRNFTKFTAKVYNASGATIAALKDYECEEAGIYLISQAGKIGAIVDNLTTPTAAYPIPIYSYAVGDKKLGGLSEPDANMIQWEFAPNWSDNLYWFTPTDFNALKDLVTP